VSRANHSTRPETRRVSSFACFLKSLFRSAVISLSSHHTTVLPSTSRLIPSQTRKRNFLLKTSHISRHRHVSTDVLLASEHCLTQMSGRALTESTSIFPSYPVKLVSPSPDSAGSLLAAATLSHSTETTLHRHNGAEQQKGMNSGSSRDLRAYPSSTDSNKKTSIDLRKHSSYGME